MSTLRRGILAVLFMAVVALAAPQTEKKSYVLRGKVEEVNTATKSLTVNHEKVEGWMDAMTMTYSVKPEDILKTVKVGDQIKAKVYDGDYTLYDVKVVPPKK